LAGPRCGRDCLGARDVLGNGACVADVRIVSISVSLRET
jgi:hypothetical protein